MISTRVTRCVLTAATLAIAGAVCTAPAANAQTFGGNELVEWSVPDAPTEGLSTITYPMTVHTDTAHQSGAYFAMQYNFIGQDDVGYTGLQPRADADGKERLHGVFSSFISGTTSTDANCSDGADGGDGVSCAVDFDAAYGHTYDVTVTHDSGTTWSGSVTDTTTGQSTHIGTYVLPGGTGNLQPSQSGFVEYYNVTSCDELQRYDVTVGGPSSGNLTGTTTYVKEYGNCLGQGGTEVTPVGSGVRISRGTPAPVEPPTTPPTTPPTGSTGSPMPLFGSS